jgi:1,4-alpha-glucan branching enzyme
MYGLGDRRHLQPLATVEGPVLWPVDRQTMALVWGKPGYPAAGAYRDYYRLTSHHHRVWRNDGRVYDATEARALAAQHARDFVERVAVRVREGGVCVCAFDTELLGHWWHEGPWWLDAVIQETARQDVRLCGLSEALERHEPAQAPADLGVGSWGDQGDLRTWSGPPVADLAWQARTAELAVMAGGRRPSDTVLRELLALQSSDWAFRAYHDRARDYARRLANAPAAALAPALTGQPRPATTRSRTPDLTGWLD